MVNKNSFLVLGIVILAILVAGGFGYFYLLKGGEDVKPEESGKASAPPEENLPGQDSSSEDFSKLEGYRTRENLPPFPEDWDVIHYGKNILSQIPPERQKEQEDMFKALVRKINQEPDTLAFWIDLGLVKKVFEDYLGARDAWEYAGLLRPKDSVSLANLGDLYWHFLPNFPKAETNFLKALENNPENLALYKDLSDLYLFSYKEKAALADDILLKGLEKNSKSVALLAWLGNYYRDLGDAAKARGYYQQALEIEPTNDSIRRELNNLSS